MMLQFRLRFWLSVLGIVLSIYLFVLLGIMIDSYVMASYKKAEAFPDQELVISGELEAGEFLQMDANPLTAAYSVYTYPLRTFLEIGAGVQDTDWYIIDFDLVGTDETFTRGGALPQMAGKVVTDPLLLGEGLTQSPENVCCIAISNYAAQLLFGSAQEALGKQIRLQSMETVENGRYATRESVNFLITAILQNGAADYSAEEMIAQQQERHTSGQPRSYNILLNAYVPLSTYRTLQPVLSKNYRVSLMFATVHMQDDIVATERAVREIYLNKAGVISRASVVKDAYNTFLGYRMMLFGLILFVSVFSGANIVNVMVFSIKERTDEIAIRKTLGATNTQIRNQIMLESCVVAMIGWVIATALAVLTAYGVYLGWYQQLQENFRLTVEAKTILSGFFLAVIMGVTFSVIPAMVAARVPIATSLRRNL